nr:retrovirus-related Pol polyprotein from transposon TNT 1-94 [Tanacetum cinerariifolium]
MRTLQRNKVDLEEQSLDDLFNSLKIYKAEVKHSFIGTTAQILAFVSSSNTNSTTVSVSAAASVYAICAKLHVSSLPNVDSLSNAVIYSFFASQSTSPHLDNEDLNQIDVDYIEEMDLRWSPKDLRRNDAAEPQRRTVPVETSTSNDLVSQYNGVGSYDWSYQAEEEPANYALMAFSSSSSSPDNESDCESWPPTSLYDRFQPSVGYHDVPPPYTGTFMPPKPDLVFNTSPIAVETDHPAFIVQLSPTKPAQALSHTNRHAAPIIEDWPVETSIPAATPELASPKPVSSVKRRNRKACFVCKSMDHLIKDYDYHAKKMVQPTPKNHAHRGNHKQYAPLTHTNPQKHMVPAVILTQSKPVSITVVRPGNPQHVVKDKGVIDSGCSRHMTGNMSYLFDFEELNDGYVTFGGNPKGGKISGKGKIKTFLWDEGIKREFSVPRTPQQNGIAERKNRTLIEAARTMLADSLLPIPFWAEAVNTACYVQNRVLVTKPQNKTPYELLHGRTPSIGFMRPFGCPVTILNTLDSLGKFDGKVDEGFLVGYSSSGSINPQNNDGDAAFDRNEHDFDAKKPEFESSGSINPQNNDGDAAFDRNEHDFDAKKPEFEVSVSPSSSAQSRKQDDKTKKEAKGKSPIKYFTGYRDLSAKFEDFFDNSINKVNAAELEDITYSDDEDDVGAEADLNNLETSITEEPKRVHQALKDP